VKSDNGIYYALYSDNTWKESSHSTDQVIKAINNRKNPPAKEVSTADVYGIVSSSPTRTITSSNKSSSSAKSYQNSRISSRRKSRTYI